MSRACVVVAQSFINMRQEVTNSRFRKIVTEPSF